MPQPLYINSLLKYSMTLDNFCYARYENLAQNQDHQKISVILLFIFRKILAVCLMKLRIQRIDKELPPSQAAYRKGRSTTEHVFATKLIIERTITSNNETFYLPMHDMSKAFDSINRTILIQDLNVIDKDELHLMKMLLDVNLAVKCNDHIGGGGSSFIQTNVPLKAIGQVRLNSFSTSPDPCSSRNSLYQCKFITTVKPRICRRHHKYNIRLNIHSTRAKCSTRNSLRTQLDHEYKQNRKFYYHEMQM